MPFSRCNLRNALGCAAIFGALALAGCGGNTCFVGFSNNGSGVVIVKAGNPANCVVPNVFGTMSVVVVRLAACETCMASAHVQHVVVSLRGIQLRPAIEDGNSPKWLELAPQLAAEPRQIDLMGDPVSRIVVQNASVPAGSYGDVRLQFSSASPINGEEIRAENACGEMGRNCIVSAGGRVEALSLPEAGELVIPLERVSLAVLPDTHAKLQLRLQPHEVFAFSSIEGMQIRNVLSGQATITR